MSNENLKPSDDNVAVEQSLATFAPRAALVDRDRLMFLAGAAAADPTQRPVASGQGPGARIRRHAWPAATAALAATSLALAVALSMRPEPQVQIVYQSAPETTAVAVPLAAAPPVPTASVPMPIAQPRVKRQLDSSSPVLPADNYLRTREVALRMGLDAIGSPGASCGGGSASPTYFDWLSGLSEAPQVERPVAIPPSM